MSIRARLTITCALLVLAVAGLLIAGIYVFMRYAPNYHFGRDTDELTDPADTFDRMLARLERVFQAQQRFAVNASHELRTPLAATQAVLDVAPCR